MNEEERTLANQIIIDLENLTYWGLPSISLIRCNLFKLKESPAFKKWHYGPSLFSDADYLNTALTQKESFEKDKKIVIRTMRFLLDNDC